MPSQNNARARLLDAAEQLFCEQGFDRTSIRDLTALAGCNVAAVNYHFGGKQQLYIEMFRRQMHKVTTECVAFMDEVMASSDPSLEMIIRGWVTPPLKAIERDEPRGRIMMLLVREIVNQTLDPAMVTQDLKDLFVVQMTEAFCKLVPGLDRERAILAVFSVEALLFHPFLFAPFYMNWIHGLDMDGIIDHIVRFAAAGIRSFSTE